MHPTRRVKSRLLIHFISMIMLVLIAAGSSQNWQILAGNITPYTPRQAVDKPIPLAPRFSGDLNSDGNLECLALVDQTLQITDCQSDVLWQSPSDRRVTEAQIGDLNRDGLDEAILLVWRPFKPWPVDKFMPYGGRIKEFHDQNGDSCQIILIGWARNDWRELWAGSALVSPVERLGVADLDGDGWQELAALERPYDTKQPNTDLTVWKWLGFGFTLIDRVKGSFYDLSIFRDSSQSWLVTQ